jgi:hypothetical protein
MDNLGNQQACQQPAQPGPNQKGLPQRGPWQQPWICWMVILIFDFLIYQINICQASFPPTMLLHSQVCTNPQ